MDRTEIIHTFAEHLTPYIKKYGGCYLEGTIDIHLDSYKYMYNIVELPEATLKLLSSRKDRLYIWNLSTGICETVLKGRGTHISVVDYFCSKNDEIRIISGTDDGTIKIWNLSKCIMTLSRINEPVAAVLVHNNKIIMGHQNGKIVVWNTEGEFINEFSNSPDVIIFIKPLSTGKVAVYSYELVLRIWDFDIGKCILCIPSNIMFDPDSNKDYRKLFLCTRW